MPETFQEYAKDRGWRWYEEWVPEMEDDDGTVMGGFFQQLIVKEVPVGERRLLYTMTVKGTEHWDPLIELAEAGLARLLAEHA